MGHFSTSYAGIINAFHALLEIYTQHECAAQILIQKSSLSSEITL